jgi:hypothetical protein
MKDGNNKILVIGQGCAPREVVTDEVKNDVKQDSMSF